MAKPAWMTEEVENKARKGGDYEPLELGGHKCYIVEIQPFKTSKSTLNAWRVLYDTCPDDRQPLYYRDKWDKDTRTDKKWSGTMHSYIIDENASFLTKKGEQSFYGRDNLARITTAIEDSNPGFQINWEHDYNTEEFCMQFKGRKIGIVFGREFYSDPATHEARMAVKPRYFCNIEGVEDKPIPKDKEEKKPDPAPGAAGEAGFMHIADNLEDEGLPFNV